MIKWLWCMLIGHKLDVTTTRCYIIYFEGQEKNREKQLWCQRCQKYRSV